VNRWNILCEYGPDLNVIELLLKNRGIVTEEEREMFLEPPNPITLASTFPSEFKRSLIKCRDTIVDAVEKDIPIIIHGDYDADGICAAAILYNTLAHEKNYSRCFVFIPNRFDHGYGLSVKSIDAVLKSVEESLGESPKDALIISVDSGITSVGEVEYIRSLGFQTIITDHHQKPAVLPEADCIVWNDKLVGASIAWYVSKTLGSKDRQSVALAALATVTDLQSLQYLNRSIVKEGLKVLNSDPPLGIKKLLEVSGRREGEVTTYDLGWVLGPRLNASGRIVDARDSLELLIGTDENVLEDIALNLNRVNSERQDKTVEMYEVAGAVTSDKPPKLIISHNEEYHEGIIGLVAAKLTQKYYRPSIVISLSDGQGKGSVRSIKGVDVISMLREHDDLFENLGGHPMAAGFTILRENIPVLEERLLPFFEEKIDDELLIPVLDIDLKIPLRLVDLDLAEEIDGLKPFGIGNPEPVLLSEKVGVAGLNIVGKESSHYSLRILDDGNFYKGIYFNGVGMNGDLSTGDTVDIVYKIRTSEFNGNKKVELVIEDLRKSV
jgi:single-stranded-DNA-specific exonuclease